MSNEADIGAVTRVRGMGELLALVPYQLGFTPGRCVVVVVVRQGLLGGIIRLPCPDEGWSRMPVDAWGAVAGGLNNAWDRSSRRPRPSPYDSGLLGDGAVLATYDLSAHESWQAHSVLTHVCEAAGVPITVRLTVSGGRWCPLGLEAGEEWEPLPPPAEVPAVSEYVGRGVFPLPHRDDLRRRLAADTSSSAPVAEALASVRGGHVRADVGLGVEAVSRWLTPPGIREAPANALLTAQGLLLLEQPLWRDAAYHRVAPSLCDRFLPTALEAAARALIPDGAHDVVGLLAEVAPSAPPGDRGNLLALLALAAWAAGEGPLAWAASQEALDDDEQQVMAQTVTRALLYGLACEPDAWVVRPGA